MNEELKEAINGLLNSFPKSFVNYNNEFIAHERTNQYIILTDCKSLLDIECKVLEWFSRAAHKTQPYSQGVRNWRFQEFMLNGINNFLDTKFTTKEIETIYEHLGNAINHQKTIEFIKSEYDFNVLK
jgi:hypothetical protein